jgi:hypothetical protein
MQYFHKLFCYPESGRVDKCSASTKVIGGCAALIRPTCIFFWLNQRFLKKELATEAQRTQSNALLPKKLCVLSVSVANVFLLMIHMEAY